jgi:hypothetical protein
MMKRWVTGEQAEMDQDDIDRELFELAREWMEVSKLKKLPGHVAKETDVSLWKQFRDWTKKKGAVRIRAFRCPLKHRTGCNAGIRIQYGPDWMQLDRCGEHNANSHDQCFTVIDLARIDEHTTPYAICFDSTVALMSYPCPS